MEKDLFSLQISAYQSVVEEKKTSETWRTTPARCSGAYAYLGEANRRENGCLHFQHFFFSLRFPKRKVALSDGKLHPCSTVLSGLKSTKNQDWHHCRWRWRRAGLHFCSGTEFTPASSIILPMKWCPWLSHVSPHPSPPSLMTQIQIHFQQFPSIFPSPR